MFELNLNFPNRSENDLNTLNCILSGVALKDLEFDFESYRSTTTRKDFQHNTVSVTHSCGFDSVQIKGYQEEDSIAEDDQRLQHYQVYTAYLPAEQYIDREDYISQWKAVNPQYFVRIYTTIGNDSGGMSYVVVYTVD